MKNTVEFLDAVKAKHSLTSDYQLSKHLGCTPSAVGNYRHGKSKFDEEMACRIAAELSLEPGYVLACIASERAKKPEVKKAWAHAAELLYGIAATFLLVSGLVIMTNPEGATIHLNNMFLFAGFTFDPAIHYAQGVWLEWAVFLLLFGGLLAVFPWHTPPKNNRDGRRKD